MILMSVAFNFTLKVGFAVLVHVCSDLCTCGLHNVVPELISGHIIQKY